MASVPCACQRVQLAHANTAVPLLLLLTPCTDSDDNIFKKIIDGVIPSHKIFETEHALAILDAFPMTRGHALLLPKVSGYAELYDMPPDVAAGFLRELPRLCKAVKAATGCDGVNVVQNNGGAAGQVVFHVHFHVIPRVEGDGIVRLGAHGSSSKMIEPAAAKEIGDAIRAAL
jgi:histidine triad (HIT) family protein